MTVVDGGARVARRIDSEGAFSEEAELLRPRAAAPLRRAASADRSGRWAGS